MSHVYQLVVEFEGDDLENFDRLIDFEDALSKTLSRDLIDGHDIGQGIVNIFIHSDDPQRCFEEALHVIEESGLSPSAAAYRRRDGEDYVRVWPKEDSAPFSLR